MIYYKDIHEVEKIRSSSLLVSKTLAELASIIKPGVSPLDLDARAEEFIMDNQAIPGFKGYKGFPATICASKNNEIVHGIPNHVPLVDGDIISIDCGVLKDGFYGDSAYTFTVGNITEEIEELLFTTKRCLNEGINNAINGKRIGDIGSNIQKMANDKGYGIVKELVGHGIGKKLHEEPNVPNYGKAGSGTKLSEGLVIAIEPMLNIGSGEICTADDGWTIVTKDGSLSAHFEHTIAIGVDEPDILSDFKIIEKEINKIYG